MWPWRRRRAQCTGPLPKTTWTTGSRSAGDDAYELETLADGSVRVVVAARKTDVDLLLTLADGWGASQLVLLYVLTTSRTDAHLGRYQHPAFLSRDDVEAWLRKYEAFLCQDARHALWIIAVDCAHPRQLVLDQHDVIYLYGDPDADRAALKALGFKAGSVDLDRIHAHHYHPEHDALERSLLAEHAWSWFPLQDCDDPGRTDTEDPECGRTESGQHRT